MRGDLSKRRNIWSTNNFAFLKADDDLISMVMMVMVMMIVVMMMMTMIMVMRMMGMVTIMVMMQNF